MPPSTVGLKGSCRCLWPAMANGEVLWEVWMVPAATSHTQKFKPSLLQADPTGIGLSQRGQCLQPHSAPSLPPVGAPPAKPSRCQVRIQRQLVTETPRSLGLGGATGCPPRPLCYSIKLLEYRTY